MTFLQTEQDYRAAIQAAYAIRNTDELWYAMTHLAGLYIERGLIQLPADILAFVLLQDEIDRAIHDHADALFDGLERRICPRVIWDARAFAADMLLEDMVGYVLDDVGDDEN